MSFFDPHYLYSHPQRKSHKGQIIQKKAVKHSYALTDQDLQDSIKVLNNFGYYVSPTPPLPTPLHSTFENYTITATPNTYRYSISWNYLNNYINSFQILQNAPANSPFSLFIYLTSISCYNDTGSSPYDFTLSTDKFTISTQESNNYFIDLTLIDDENFQMVNGIVDNFFTYSSNVIRAPYSTPGNYFANYVDIDLNTFREEGLPSTPIIQISNSNIGAQIKQVNLTFSVSINIVY